MAKRPRGRPREQVPKSERVSFTITAAQMDALRRYRAAQIVPPTAATVARDVLLAFLRAQGFLP